MVEAILLALLCAKLKGYKLKPLFKSWHIYPILLFGVVYIFLEAAVFMGNYSYIRYAKYFETLYIGTFLILILRYNQYKSAIIGAVFIFIGTLLNKIAISANGGKMPVFPSLSYVTGYVKPDSFTKVKDIHILGSSAVRLKYLTDIFDLGYTIMSIGDVLIKVFAFIVVYCTIKDINETRKDILQTGKLCN